MNGYKCNINRQLYIIIYRQVDVGFSEWNVAKKSEQQTKRHDNPPITVPPGPNIFP